MADVVAQAVSIVPPQISGAASPAQQSTLSGAGVLSPRVVIQAADMAPGVRTGRATSSQQSILGATLQQAPRVVAMALPGSALAATGTQQSTLGAVGGTGPQPRSMQRSTLLARGQLQVPGGFSYAVPQRTLAAGGLLTLHGSATLCAYTWLVAGVVQVHRAATGTQQQTTAGTGQVVIPHFGRARLLGTQALAAQPQVRHPIAVLGAPLWRAGLMQVSTLVARGVLAARRGHYQSARGLAGGRARYHTERGLRAGLYRYHSTQGEAVSAIPVPPTPVLCYLRSREKNVPFQIDFARDVASGDSISSASVRVFAQPLEQEGTVPTTDVTSALLISQAAAGTLVSVVLGNANAQPGTEYSVRVVATMASGLVLQETIGGGPQSRLLCDE